MNKKGQIDLSFGMIFSIIIIVATIAVAFYAISHFLSLKKCTDVSLFYKDFQDSIDQAWRSDAYQDVFTHSLPSSVKSVCVGYLNQTSSSADREERDELKNYYVTRPDNMFLYPRSSTCKELSYAKVNHLKLEQFVCFPVNNGKIKVTLAKSSFDPLVSIRNYDSK